MTKEVSIETLLQKDKKKYLAILFFTLQFTYKKKWFRLYHYRYALQKNHNLSYSFQKSISKTFGSELINEYNNPYSFINKCFNSRSNLIDHLNNLVKIDILKREIINEVYHYQLNTDFKDKLFYAFECAWFNSLTKKVPYEILRKIRNHIESEFEKELKKYNAMFYSIS